MSWLPQFLWASGDTHKHLNILVNHLKTLNAHTQHAESPLRNVFNSLNLIINTVAQGTNTLSSPADLTDAVNNIIINIIRIQAPLQMLGNISEVQAIEDRPNVPLRIVSLQIIATLGTWCYEQRKILIHQLLFDANNDEETIAAQYHSALAQYLDPDALANATPILNDIYQNFQIHYAAAQNKRKSGILGALLGGGIVFGIIFFTGGAPLWFLIGAPLLGGFDSSHLMEWQSTNYYKPRLYPIPEPGDMAVVGGSSARMGPIQPSKNTTSPDYFAEMKGGQTLGVDPEPNPELSEIQAKGKKATSPTSGTANPSEKRSNRV